MHANELCNPNPDINLLAVLSPWHSDGEGWTSNDRQEKKMPNQIDKPGKLYRSTGGTPTCKLEMAYLVNFKSFLPRVSHSHLVLSTKCFTNDILNMCFSSSGLAGWSKLTILVRVF